MTSSPHSNLRPSFSSLSRIGLRRGSSPYRHPRKTQAHRLSSSTSNPNLSGSARSSNESVFWSDSSSEIEPPLTPATDNNSDRVSTRSDLNDVAEVDVTKSGSENASTTLVTQDPNLLRKAVGDGENGTQLIQKYCCGGGCCLLNAPPPLPTGAVYTPLDLPDNDAFRELRLKLGPLAKDTELTEFPAPPPTTISFSQKSSSHPDHHSRVHQHPPTFVKPHYPYQVFSAPLYSARELTKKGAEKRTFHFDIDVTDYPQETGEVDFKVGGAVGVCPPNMAENVDEVFDLLGLPRSLRDKPVMLHTTSGRWPTIWGEDQPRSLVTTRRELLTWCSDIQSYPPTKHLLRLLAEHATAANEKKILLYLCSAQGQPAFCDLRTGPHISLIQLLHAFPSSRPPLESLLSSLSQLMPRFYSLSNDPHVSSAREGLAGRRLIEVAVTVHETPNFKGGPRTGVGSGFLERLAHKYINGSGASTRDDSLRVPLFRGLMANPLSKQFSSSAGPMLLIGAGVGMAPFRGFILNRLRDANCAQKIWLIQGIRDASIDELYSGELGAYEGEIKKVVQSRRSQQLRQNVSETDLRGLGLRKEGERSSSSLNLPQHFRPHTPEVPESKYVQDEVKQQADVVWDIVRALDGRIFVCGASKGMGEGVEEALRDVAMQKNLEWSEETAQRFWDEMKDAGKYVAETW